MRRPSIEAGQACWPGACQYLVIAPCLLLYNSALGAGKSKRFFSRKARNLVRVVNYLMLTVVSTFEKSVRRIQLIPYNGLIINPITIRFFGMKMRLFLSGFFLRAVDFFVARIIQMITFTASFYFFLWGVNHTMIRKIKRVQKVLKEASLHTQQFQKSSQMGCPSGCSLCCLKKDIFASPLEFLPFAYHLHKADKAEAFYDELELRADNTICGIFTPISLDGWGCTEYEHRGLICRLFGYSTTSDKMQQKRMVTCKTLKETTAYEQVKPAQLIKAPSFQDYYMKLAAIDFQLANESLPINQAIKRAIELVSTYYSYRGNKKPA